MNKKDFLEILPILSVSDDITSLRKISNPIELEKRMMEIMRLIRGSWDYRLMVSWHRIRHQMNLGYFGEDEYDTETFTVELHHVITLWDITWLTGLMLIDRLENVSIYQIAEEVMKFHYDDLVWLVPVGKSEHELIHSGEINVDWQKVHGDGHKLKEILYEFMSESDKTLWDQTEELINEFEVR